MRQLTGALYKLKDVTVELMKRGWYSRLIKVRYRKSLGEDITRLKNKIHVILSRYGIHINASDIFGKKGLKEIEKVSSILSPEDRSHEKSSFV